MNTHLASDDRFARLMAVFLVAGAAALRVLPHPWNFTPVAAVAVFAGAALPRRVAVAVPVAAMAASDLVLGLHSVFPVTWASFAAIAWAAGSLRERGFAARLAGTAGGSVFFFFTTNLAVFFVDGLYPMTPAGLLECFAMALPFFRNALAGDLVYGIALFGAFGAASAFSRRSAAEGSAR